MKQTESKPTIAWALVDNNSKILSSEFDYFIFKTKRFAKEGKEKNDKIVKVKITPL